MKKTLIISKQNLKGIIKGIVLSKYFKERFEINGEINNDEIECLVKDIEENVILSEFESDNDISNFIIAYIKKFIETTENEKLEYLDAIIYGNTKDVNEITGKYKLCRIE